MNTPTNNNNNTPTSPDPCPHGICRQYDFCPNCEIGGEEKPEAEEKGCTCPAPEEHPCPYDQEIDGNDGVMCVCCEVCERRCCESI